MLNQFHDASWYYASGKLRKPQLGEAFVNGLNLDGTRFTVQAGYNKTQFKDEFAEAPFTVCAPDLHHALHEGRPAGDQPNS